MREIVIAPPEEGKGRAFSATVLASVEADPLWEQGRNSNDTIRPLWIMVAGSEQSLRSFVANLRTGRKATFPRKDQYGYRYGKEDKLEILRSSGFNVAWQKMDEGSIATLYHPEFFQMDPGLVDPERIKFLLLAPREWCERERQSIDCSTIVRHLKGIGYDQVKTDQELADLAVISYLFATYLDRRTRCPLVADGRFYAQLLMSCLHKGLATIPAKEEDRYRDRPFGVHKNLGLTEYCTADVGLMPPILMSADHVTFEKLLAEEVTQYIGRVR